MEKAAETIRLSYSAISPWRRRLSACYGFTVDILSTFCGLFMVQCVKLMLRIFFNFGFYSLTVLFIAQMYGNSSETFNQVWALHRTT